MKTKEKKEESLIVTGILVLIAAQTVDYLPRFQRSLCVADWSPTQDVSVTSSLQWEGLKPFIPLCIIKSDFLYSPCSCFYIFSLQSDTTVSQNSSLESRSCEIRHALLYICTQSPQRHTDNISCALWQLSVLSCPSGPISGHHHLSSVPFECLPLTPAYLFPPLLSPSSIFPLVGIFLPLSGGLLHSAL